MNLPTQSAPVNRGLSRFHQVQTLQQQGCNWFVCGAKVVACAAACASSPAACVACLGSAYDTCKDCF